LAINVQQAFPRLFYLHIEPGIKHRWFRIEIWLKDSYLMHPHKSHKRAGSSLSISEYPCLSGAHFNTGGKQSLYYPVIAKSALFGCAGFWVKKPCSIRTCLNTILASYTIFRINKDDSIIRLECCSYRTNLNTRGFSTLIAQLRHKKASDYPLLTGILLETIHSPVGAVYYDFASIIDNVPLHPCSEIKGQGRHIILLFAGVCTPAASNASIYPYSHSPGVFFRIVVFAIS
jgi:hypothetical protein